MSYDVKKTKSKHRTWRLLFLKRDYFESGKRLRDYETIPPENYGLHGFRADMPYDEANQKEKALNRVIEDKRQAARKVAITNRIESETAVLSVAFPNEKEFVQWCIEEHRVKFKGSMKHESHWHAAKKMLAELKLTPPDYYDSRRKMY